MYYWVHSGLTTHSKNRATWLLFLLTAGRSEGKSGRLPKIDPNFNVSFPTTECSLPFTKRTCCTMILKRMQLTSLEWNIEHQTLYGSNFRNMGAPFMWILKKKYDYWWKKYGLEKTDRATKISLFDRNWAISLKPRLVWWALGALSECLSFKCGCSSSSFYWTIKVIKTLVEFVCKCSFFWIVLCHYVQLCTSWQANCVSLTNTYFRSFPRSWLINGFVTRLTRWVSLMEQELLTLPEHLSSPPVFSGVRVTWSLVLFVCFVDRFLYFFFWPLCCLFFEIRILITSLWYLQTSYYILVLVSE